MPEPKKTAQLPEESRLDHVNGVMETLSGAIGYALKEAVDDGRLNSVIVVFVGPTGVSVHSKYHSQPDADMTPQQLGQVASDVAASNYYGAMALGKLLASLQSKSIKALREAAIATAPETE